VHLHITNARSALKTILFYFSSTSSSFFFFSCRIPPHVFFVGSYDELQEGRAGRACKGCGVAYDLVAGRGGAPSDGGAALWFNPALQARPSGSGFNALFVF
jgi:hypothetical protein